MKNYRLETIEHGWDDVPWHADDETFKSIEALQKRINELKKIARYNEITLLAIDCDTNEVVKSESLDRKLFDN